MILLIRRQDVIDDKHTTVRVLSFVVRALDNGYGLVYPRLRGLSKRIKIFSSSNLTCLGVFQFYLIHSPAR
ncbi:hypothetical protein BRADI_2g33323v3 [Brachypodium distachyon]|uniref:Uncharacterized protein n=1 Tax=Brachypodium distachyon TaxID=15368 RepID=A0A2K2DBL2_BRADI|nr:hypothetical protein BRADI_2g33323v3 [Brachypodium distachyon]